MKASTSIALAAAALLGLSAAPALAGGDMVRVTITNTTAGQYFTPALVFSQDRRGMPFFTPGMAAGTEVEQLAEGGNSAPLLDKLMMQGHLTDYANVGGLIGPGESAAVELMADEDGGIGLAAMLIPTNDGFIGASGIMPPHGRGETTVTLAAMDAGTEVNDESCASIPGPPPCGGEGVSAAGGEGYVHTHRGIHGIGDLDASEKDWRNPVATVRVERVRH